MTAPDSDPPPERAYRRLLNLLPPAYRRARGREILDVLMQGAPPGSRRPSIGEVVAIFRLGARTWAAWLFVPHRAASRDAGALLAVFLPVLLLLPAASALTTAWQTRSGVTELPFGVGTPGWVLTGLAAVLVLLGRTTSVRWAAWTGLAAAAVGFGAEWADGNFRTVADGLGWLGVQVVATFAVAAPDRVERGRRLVRPWVRSALGAGFAAAGFVLAISYRLAWDGVSYRGVLAVVAVIGLALAVRLLISRVGRAVLPLVGSMAAFMVVTKNRTSFLGNAGTEIPSWQPFTMQTVVVIAVVPVAAFLFIRVLTAAADRSVGRS